MSLMSCWSLSLAWLIRTIGHMSQEPWPCNGEDPWLTSKCCTIGVGKAILCSHGPSSKMWSENIPFCGTFEYFVGGKKRGGLGFNIICIKLYLIWENYLVVFFCHEIYPATCHEIYLAIKNYSKSHGHPEFALGPPRGGGPDKNFETS